MSEAPSTRTLILTLRVQVPKYEVETPNHNYDLNTEAIPHMYIYIYIYMYFYFSFTLDSLWTALVWIYPSFRPAAYARNPHVMTILGSEVLFKFGPLWLHTQSL